MKFFFHCCVLTLAVLSPAGTFAQSKPALLAKGSVELPGVKGGFDLMAYDAVGGRLFLSAQDNHTVEIISLKKQAPVITLPGFNEPKWVFYHQQTGTLYVATGKDGRVTAVDGHTFRVLKTYTFREKCNNLRFDPLSNQLFVGVGDTFGAIGIIDLNTQTIVAQIPLADFPKQFEVTRDRIYVNVPAKSLIQVIDRKSAKVTASWSLHTDKDNVPMALDEKHDLLYIGCAGGRLLVLSARTGKELGSAVIHKDVDGVYLDAKRQRLYISCGEGFIDVLAIHQHQLQPLQQIRTRPGAGTSLLIPERDQYILAEPQAGALPALIQTFQPVL